MQAERERGREGKKENKKMMQREWEVEREEETVGLSEIGIELYKEK